MSRFGISLGTGDKTVEEVCGHCGVDCATFLKVANFICGNPDRIEDCFDDFSLPALMDYLRRSHSYFLDFQLPFLRQKLAEAVKGDGEEMTGEVAVAILRYYDEYTAEVRKHMEYEDRTVFKYVDALLKGKKPQYNITVYCRKHTPIDVKLAELKNIIIKYYPARPDNYLLNSALYDIFSCEEDLISHMHVENYLFTPAVKALEEGGLAYVK